MREVFRRLQIGRGAEKLITIRIMQMENITLTVNGTTIQTTAGKTILEVVNEHNLDQIPTLCDDKRLEHYTSCFLCVVEVEGMNKLVPSCSTRAANGMKILTASDKVRDSRKTALELLMSNHYADCVGPCKGNCPAGVDAQTYISLIAHGDYQEAIKLVKENNPLPLSICRVCVRDCELACRRNNIDEPVAINSLKRFIADFDAPAKWTPPVKRQNGFRIAIVGSGPAGLTAAYYLAIEGYTVTIFEKYPEPGGMLRYGIPEYRLPKQVLDDEINWIRDLGVTMKTGVSLGSDFSIEDLQREGYHSIFIAVGAHKASKLGLAGEEQVTGLYRGIDFLREVQMHEPPALEGTVIVVGGGNTAIDAARTALRCGASKVQIVYRRSIHEMPAHPEEIAAAQTEGIEILFLTNPKSLITDNNRVTGIECLKMCLEETRPGERPRPVPVEGSEFIVPCDWLISAIGQNVDTAFASRDSALELARGGTIDVNKETLETSIPGVFAGGDAVTGPFTAISSIAQGKKAATAIMRCLESGKTNGAAQKFYSFKHKLAPLVAREFESFNKQQRIKQGEIDVPERIHCFREVELGYTESDALNEAKRCIECGCSEYADCRLRQYCDDYKIDVSGFIGETRKYKIDGRHPFIQLDPNKCINCGKCVRTCSEILKVSALGFVNRGFKSIVKPAMEKALSETNCISCGNCIDVCPTGAITEKLPFKTLGTLEKESIISICNFCSLGCKINFKKISDTLLYVSNSSEEIKDSHNQGFLCAKGRFGHRYLLQRDRVQEAVIRRNGLIHKVSIDEAILYTGRNLKQIIEEYGSDAVAVMASPKLSNEELYLLQKFTRVGLQNNNISSFSNLLYSLEADSLDESLGFTGSTIRIDDLDNADVIVLMNANLSEEYLPLELKIKAAQKRGAKIVLFSSAETKLTKSADLWLDCKKGSGTLLLCNMMQQCVANGSADTSFIAARTENFTPFFVQLASLDTKATPGYTGVDREKMETFAELMQNQESNIAFIYNLDSTGDKSVNDLKAIGNFLLLSGRAEKAGNGLLLLRELNNSASTASLGISPDYLPGAVTRQNKKAIRRLGEKWFSRLTDVFRPVDLLKRLKRGEIKALLLFGEDPLLVKNNRKYLSNIEFLVVSDAFHNTAMEDADVVLPASTFIEQEGSYTRCDNAVQYAPRVIRGKLPLANWEIIQKLASLFSPQFRYVSVSDINKEILEARNIPITGDPAQPDTSAAPKRKYVFSTFDTDLSTFDPIKPIIHYQENYYFSHIKMQLH
jgi:formate dehydrogenase major subunit